MANRDGYPVNDIEDFLGPGQWLHDHLEDERLMDDVDWQRDVVERGRATREQRAYEDALADAENAGCDEPAQEKIAAYVRMYEEQELDEVPRTM